MITTAITAAIGAILTFFGIPPGPYLGAVWIGVKICIVAIIALLGLKTLREKNKPALAPVQMPGDQDRP